MSSTFGKSLRVTTFGESHGAVVGAVVDGLPAGLRVSREGIQRQLDRRRPGQSSLTTPRMETDQVSLLSGIEDGITLGSPVTLMVENADQRPSEYEEFAEILRPSHADFTTLKKYGRKSKSGGGRASARETVGRVAAGALAEQLLQHVIPDLAIVAWVDQVHAIKSHFEDIQNVTRAEVDAELIRCPKVEAAQVMAAFIEQIKAEGDSVGGIIRCVVRGLPSGLGEPVFDKFEAELAKAMLSLPATKGFEIGSGFSAAVMKGSEHNDLFVQKGARIGTMTNRSGGVQGGISNGEIIDFRVAFKPVATIAKMQQSVTIGGESRMLQPKLGRHDPCVLPRAVPMVEAMTALVLGDLWLRHLDDRLP